MKRILCLVLTLLMLCSLTVPTFAAQIHEDGDVVVKYLTTYQGEYRAEVSDGEAAAGGITVTGAPANALTLVVTPMNQVALEWVDSCVEGDVLAAFDIHFLDASGNRINADGVQVDIHISGNALAVFSVTDTGKVEALASQESEGKLTFTTDGSHYYAVTRKSSSEKPGDPLTVPIGGEGSIIHAQVTVKDDTVTLHDLSPEEIQHIVHSTGMVQIDLTGLDENVTKIDLPVTIIKQILEAHKDIDGLQIGFPTGSVKLDNKTMCAIVEQVEGNTVRLALEKVGKTRLNRTQKKAIENLDVYDGYEAYLLCVATNKRISDLGGGVVTLSVPFQVPNGLDTNGFSAWYVADDGYTKKLTTRYENGEMVWSVDCFSDFMIIYESPEGETPPDAPTTPGNVPGTGDTARIGLWIVLMAASLLAMVILLMRYARNVLKK